jgi:very-short-patch-repair endonuclease
MSDINFGINWEDLKIVTVNLSEEKEAVYHSFMEDLIDVKLREIGKGLGYKVERDKCLQGTYSNEGMVISGLLFAQVDFYLEKENIKINLEMDDISHDPVRDYKRDVQSVKCGYKIVRIWSVSLMKKRREVIKNVGNILSHPPWDDVDIVFIGSNPLVSFQFNYSGFKIDDPFLRAKVGMNLDKTRKVAKLEDVV